MKYILVTYSQTIDNKTRIEINKIRTKFSKRLINLNSWKKFIKEPIIVKKNKINEILLKTFVKKKVSSSNALTAYVKEL